MQVPGVKMSGCISYIYSWVVVITDTARALFFIVYIPREMKMLNGLHVPVWQSTVCRKKKTSHTDDALNAVIVYVQTTRTPKCGLDRS
jgi:hypothetical protein